MSTTAADPVSAKTKAAEFIEQIADCLSAGETSGIPPVTMQLPPDVADELGAMGVQDLATALTASITSCTHGSRTVVYHERTEPWAHGEMFELSDPKGFCPDGAVVDRKAGEVRFFCRRYPVAC